MFDLTIAADVGSANTRVAVRSAISTNATRAAIDPANSSRVLAVGEAGRALLGTAEAYPVRGGVADITLAALMLRRFALDLTGRRTLFGMSALLAVPFSSGEIRKNALVETGREAGFKRVLLMDSMLAGALGVGIDIGADRASMLVDIGRDTLTAAVFANGGIVSEAVFDTGSAIVDKHIRAYFAEEHHLLISARTAERLKQNLDKPVLKVSCRDSATGLPSSREIRPSALRETAMFSIGMMAASIAAAADRLPPDCAADLVDGGITLIGGGAEQYMLPESLEALLGIPVRAAKNAGSAVILGMQQFLRDSQVRALAAKNVTAG